MLEKQYGKLTLHVCDNREELGRAAAAAAGDAIRALLAQKESINCIFAAAPSQNEFLRALTAQDLPWERIEAFHMDEYVGLAPKSPQSFSGYLTEAVFGRVPFRRVELLNGTAEPEAECSRYSALLEAAPPDLVFCGVGENGHLAFNDPPVADFQDSALVKVVTLERTCREQQVHDGCFPALEAVPERALTLTIPALTAAPKIFCMVPGKLKAGAIAAALEGEIGEHCPASVLRQHSCELYIDRDCADGLAL